MSNRSSLRCRPCCFPAFTVSTPHGVLQRLEDLNLLTLGTIASVSLAHLQVALGTPANLLHDWALGIDPSPVHPPIAQSMIERSLHLLHYRPREVSTLTTVLHFTRECGVWYDLHVATNVVTVDRAL